MAQPPTATVIEWIAFLLLVLLFVQQVRTVGMIAVKVS